MQASHVMTAEQCRTARRGLGWHTETLAHEAEVGTATVSRFEKGHLETRPSTISKMQMAFERRGVIFEKAGVRFPDGAKAIVQVKPGALVKV